MASVSLKRLLELESELAETTSIRLVGTEPGGILRSYELLSKDLNKLPVIEELYTGSTALCIDTGVLYIYEETTSKWYMM